MPAQAQYYCITILTDGVLYIRASNCYYEGFVNVMSVGMAYWLANNRIRKRPVILGAVSHSMSQYHARMNVLGQDFVCYK